jgi:hypothetical protein
MSLDNGNGYLGFSTNAGKVFVIDLWWGFYEGF